MKTEKFILILFLLFNTGFGCTVFSLQDSSAIFVGKNLDWPVGDGLVCLNPAGIKKYSMINESDKITWISQFGSITFNQFGIDLPLGGMNEAGLVVEEASYSLSEFADSDYYLDEFQWVQYQLDTKSTVAEVIHSLDSIGIRPMIASLHYFICDRSGACAAIEYIDGKVVIHSGDSFPAKVMTNNSIDNSLKYLQKHQGFGGNLPIHNGPESPVRFVKAASMLNDFYSEQNTCKENQHYMFTVLDNVKQADTQWQIVYNISELTVQYRTSQNQDFQTVKFSENHFDKGRPKIKGINHNKTFTDFLIKNNSRFLSMVLKKYVDLDELTVTSAEQIQIDLDNYTSSVYGIEKDK